MENLNRLLLDRDRELLAPVIEEMFEVVPEMMSRKIPRANVQQAFVLDTVRKLTPDTPETRLLCVGGVEDTACETLQHNNIDSIDPDIDVTLKEWWEMSPGKYTLVFATSVLEHVDDDEAFLSYFCDLIDEDGYGVLTCDFNDEYVPGAPVPNTVNQQYTRHDLEVRLKAVLDRYGCELVGTPDWTGEPDFHYQGFDYCFATYVFRKK
jgi:hypothetical protein